MKKLPQLFKKEKKVEKRVRVEIPSGPSLKGEGSYFEDITDKVGLSGQTATHLYAIDFDLDGYTDLVTLPLFYSAPKFFIYIPETKRYKELDYNPFDMVVRASYLSFFDINRDGILDLIAGTLNLKSSLTF